MPLFELIAVTCDADRPHKPAVSLWILASREYDLMDMVELLQNIRFVNN